MCNLQALRECWVLWRNKQGARPLEGVWTELGEVREGIVWLSEKEYSRQSR